MNAKKLIKEKEKAEVKSKQDKRTVATALFNGFQQQLAQEFGLQIGAFIIYKPEGVIPVLSLTEVQPVQSEETIKEEPKVAEKKKVTKTNEE